MRVNKSRYYDYTKIDSYNAPLNVIAGGRRLGKSFGAKKKILKECILNRKRFVWIVEDSILLHRLQSNNGHLFFQNIIKFLKDNQSNTNIKLLSALTSLVVDEDEVITRGNERQLVCRAGCISLGERVIGYLIALNDFAKVKSNDFGRIDYFIVDEFIPEVINKRTRDNVFKLVSVLESACRNSQVKIYMLTNTTNITDAIACKFGLDKQKIGSIRKIFDDGGLFAVVHYVDEKEYPLHSEEMDTSITGRVATFFDANRLNKNQFNRADIKLLPLRTPNSRKLLTIQLDTKIYDFGTWQEGYYIQQVPTSKDNYRYNNFKLGEIDIKPKLQSLITATKIWFDCETTAEIFYTKLGLVLPR